MQTAGERGVMLMQDVVYMDEMAHFDRERIPERVVHAKGAGECVFVYQKQIICIVPSSAILCSR